MRSPVLVATRSPHKLREIREILAELSGPEVLDLTAAGVPYEPEEEQIELHDTFADNALAKARHFAGRTGLTTLADDSGLCVDALGGAPGVHSRRFSGRSDLDGQALDAANNALLLERMQSVPSGSRQAHYVCVAAIAEPGGSESVFEGRCGGEILTAPRGDGGFGYDPLFFVTEENATFGEIHPERKNRVSHRARAIAAAARVLSD